MRGVDNVVPDFLSRPWDPAQPDVNLLHLLVHPRDPKRSSLQSLRQAESAVLLLATSTRGVCVGHVGTQYHLPSVRLLEGTSPDAAAQQLWSALSPSSRSSPCWVGDCGGLLLYRVTCDEVSDLCESGFAWRSPTCFEKAQWWRPAHFEVLPALGVTGTGAAPELLPVHGTAPLPLLPIATSQPVSDLLSTIRDAQVRDPFLATVSKGVRLSDEGVWRDFFYVGEGDDRVLCYQRESDSRPRICVPKECRALVLRAAHGELLSGHPGIARTASVVAGSYYWH